MNRKYLGCLIGAAAGDAIGAPTETRNPTRIISHFNGPVRTFLAPPNDVFARGNKPGQVTDDFSLAYVTLQTILDANELTTHSATQSLIHWASDEYSYVHLAGPTTLAKIQQLKDPRQNITPDFVVASDNAKATNGLAMKISPIALLSHGDIDKALSMTLTIGMVTHHNTIAMAAGCAVAAATAQALQTNTSLQDILDVAVNAAVRGEKLALEQGADDLAGSNVARRIQKAVEIAQQAESTTQGIQDLIDYIGTGILAYESVPTAFGLLALFPSDPLEALYAAVNIGNDTDTIATIVGGIIGALHTDTIFPDDYLTTIDTANNYDLVALAKRIQSWSH